MEGDVAVVNNIGVRDIEEIVTDVPHEKKRLEKTLDKVR